MSQANRRNISMNVLRRDRHRRLDSVIDNEQVPECQHQHISSENNSTLPNNCPNQRNMKASNKFKISNFLLTCNRPRESRIRLLDSDRCINRSATSSTLDQNGSENRGENAEDEMSFDSSNDHGQTLEEEEEDHVPFTQMADTGTGHLLSVRSPEHHSSSENESGDVVEATADSDDLGPQATDSNDLGPQAIDSNDIGPQEIHSNDIGPQAIHSNDLLPHAIHSNDLGPQAIDSDDLGPQAIDSDDLGPHTSSIYPPLENFADNSFTDEVDVVDIRETPTFPTSHANNASGAALNVEPHPITEDSFIDTDSMLDYSFTESDSLTDTDVDSPDENETEASSSQASTGDRGVAVPVLFSVPMEATIVLAISPHVCFNVHLNANARSNIQVNAGSNSCSLNAELVFEKLNVDMERPSAPEFSTQLNRDRSFEVWLHRTTVDVVKLSDAGFYFTGVANAIRCFHCNGFLHGWLEHHVPWLEHAMFHPRCGFLRKAAGKAFIDTVQSLISKQLEITLGFIAEKLGYLPSFTSCMNARRCFLCNEELKVGANFWIHLAKFHPDSEFLRQYVGQPFVDVVQHFYKQSEITLKNVKSKLGCLPTCIEDALRLMKLRQNPAVSLVMFHGHGNRNVYAAALSLIQKGEALTPNSIEATIKKAKDDWQRVVSKSKAEVASLSPEAYIKKLEEKNRQYEQQLICKICMAKNVETVFLPCGHLVTCFECSTAFTVCPLCRKCINGVVRIFMG